jgi:hypothetical protein
LDTSIREGCVYICIMKVVYICGSENRWKTRVDAHHFDSDINLAILRPTWEKTLTSRGSPLPPWSNKGRCLSRIDSYLRKISLLDMQLRWHAGRAVQIVVMMRCYDLQCTWSDARMLQPYCTRQAWCQGGHGKRDRPGAPAPVGESRSSKQADR